MKFRLIGYVSNQNGTTRYDKSFNAKNKAEAIKLAKRIIGLACDGYAARPNSNFELCQPICKITKLKWRNTQKKYKNVEAHLRASWKQFEELNAIGQNN